MKKNASANEGAATRKSAGAQSEKEQCLVYIQFQGTEVSTKELVYRAKDAFDREHHLALINQLTLYVKPEEHAAYYVINDNFSGKIDL